MSCFKGRMMEYGSISIDRFDASNLQSTSFFISHCHSDHMIGLDSGNFVSHLKSKNFKLYCHPVTKILLLNDDRFRAFQSQIVALEPKETHIIALPVADTGCTNSKRHFDEAEGSLGLNLPERTVNVTLINAGHCPGSVMFFFEGDEGNVLYTGDFRFSPRDFPGMKALFSVSGVLKHIRTVYYDSTFCVEDCSYIPSRSETFNALIQAVADWLNPDHVTSNNKRKNSSVNCLEKVGNRWNRRILLFVAAKYGHECLIIALGKYFGLKVHVTGAKFEIYSQIGELRDHVTLDPYETPLHACAYWETESDDKKKTGRRGMKSIPCCPEAAAWDPDVLTIKSSMMWFAMLPPSEQKKVCIFDRNSGLQRILYSCHSSLTEVRDFLKFLKPDRAYPNVAPNRSSLAKVSELMSDLIPTQVDAGDLLVFSEPEKSAEKLGEVTEIGKNWNRCRSFKEWMQTNAEPQSQPAKKSKDGFRLGKFDKKKGFYVIEEASPDDGESSLSEQTQNGEIISTDGEKELLVKTDGVVFWTSGALTDSAFSTEATGAAENGNILTNGVNESGGGRVKVDGGESLFSNNTDGAKKLVVEADEDDFPLNLASAEGESREKSDGDSCIRSEIKSEEANFLTESVLPTKQLSSDDKALPQRKINWNSDLMIELNTNEINGATTPSVDYPRKMECNSGFPADDDSPDVSLKKMVTQHSACDRPETSGKLNARFPVNEDEIYVSPRKKKRRSDEKRRNRARDSCPSYPSLDLLFDFGPTTSESNPSDHLVSSQENSAEKPIKNLEFKIEEDTVSPAVEDENNWTLSLSASSSDNFSEHFSTRRSETPDLFDSPLRAETSDSSLKGSEDLFLEKQESLESRSDVTGHNASGNNESTLPALSEKGKSNSVEILFHRDRPRTPDLVTLSGGEGSNKESEIQYVKTPRRKKRDQKIKKQPEKIRMKAVVEISSDDGDMNNDGWLEKKRPAIKLKNGVKKNKFVKEVVCRS